MDPRDALHTMARRHCAQRFAHWVEAYRELEASGRASKSLGALRWEYTNEAYATFPRYLVWQAILDEVERLETRLIPTVDGLQEKLEAAGRRAQTPLSSNPSLPRLAQAAMAEERAEFARFIRSIQRSDLEDVKPLLMRRVFGREELQGLWRKLDQCWGANAGHHWWPLRNGTAPQYVLTFHTDWFNVGKQKTLREILGGHGVEHMLEFREFGEWGCEQHVDGLEAVYNGEEGYWTSSVMDWLVYASHESSITLAGEWLAQEFQRRFPDCSKYEYGGPMSTPDRRGTWK